MSLDMQHSMILSTMETLPNMDIEQHMGLVTGSAVNNKNPLSQFFHGLKNMFGGTVSNIDEVFEETKKYAIDKMIEEAHNKGANAIISIRFETIKLSGSYCEIHVYGSAVKANQF